MKTTTELVNNYNKRLGDPHGIGNPYSLNTLDFKIRMFMGKTQESSSKEGLASHMKIIKKQKGIEEDSLVCRRCFKDLDVVGEPRYNDFLIIRASDCTQPICGSCAKHNPDKYHIRFKEALKLRRLDNEIRTSKGRA